MLVVIIINWLIKNKQWTWRKINLIIIIIIIIVKWLITNNQWTLRKIKLIIIIEI